MPNDFVDARLFGHTVRRLGQPSDGLRRRDHHGTGGYPNVTADHRATGRNLGRHGLAEPIEYT